MNSISSAGTTATSASASSPGLFTRQATGLVRGVSPRSALALNLAFLAAPLIVLSATQIPATWIGASSSRAAIIGAILCIFPVLTYALFAAAMPRSGGDYVFIGRTIHPWLGFVSSVNMAIFGFTLGLAGNIYLLVTFGLSTTFSTLATQTGSSTLADWSASVATDGWAFGIGAVIAIVLGLMLCMRITWLMRVMQVLMAFMLVGLLVTIAVLLLNDRADFVDAVQSFGGSYDGVIADASKAGFTPTDSFDLGQTLLATQFIISLFVWSTGTGYVAGELRNPRRWAIRSGLTALAIVSVMAIVLFALAEHVFGNAFLGSATYLSTSGAESYPFATPSFFFFYVAMLTESTFLTVVISLGFLAAYLAVCATVMLAAVRSMFAWSFDRLVPSQLARVNSYGAPVVATLVSVVLIVGYLAYMAFGSSVTALEIYFTLIVGQLLTFVLVGIASAVFPFRRSEMYKHSFARWSVRGVPVMAIVGVAAVAVVGYAMYGYLFNDSLGANNTSGLVTWAIVLSLGIVVWPISYYVNKRRGIDILAVGREIPPE